MVLEATTSALNWTAISFTSATKSRRIVMLEAATSAVIAFWSAGREAV